MPSSLSLRSCPYLLRFAILLILFVGTMFLTAEPGRISHFYPSPENVNRALWMALLTTFWIPAVIARVVGPKPNSDRVLLAIVTTAFVAFEVQRRSIANSGQYWGFC